MAYISLPEIEAQHLCVLDLPEKISDMPCLEIEELLNNGFLSNLTLVGYGMEGLGIRMDPLDIDDGCNIPLLLKVFTRVGIPTNKLEKLIGNVNLSPELRNPHGWSINEGNIDRYMDDMLGVSPDYQEIIERNTRKQSVIRQALAYRIAHDISWSDFGFNYNPVPEMYALIIDEFEAPIGFIAEFIQGVPADHEDMLEVQSQVRRALLPHRVVPDGFGKGNIIINNEENPMFIDFKYLGNPYSK